MRNYIYTYMYVYIYVFNVSQYIIFDKLHIYCHYLLLHIILHTYFVINVSGCGMFIISQV